MRTVLVSIFNIYCTDSTTVWVGTSQNVAPPRLESLLRGFDSVVPVLVGVERGPVLVHLVAEVAGDRAALHGQAPWLGRCASPVGHRPLLLLLDIGAARGVAVGAVVGSDGGRGLQEGPSALG